MQLKIIVVLLVTVLRSTFCLNDEEKEDIRRLIKHTKSCSDLPGFIVTVIDNNKVEMKEGFGSLDLDSDGSIANEHSSFSIGSLSKAFTAALMTKVLEKSNYTMDSLLKDIIPELDLGNEINTNQATVRDLLSHKLGYVAYGFIFATGLSNNIGRQQYCSRLHLLKSVGFRREFR